MSTIFPFSCRSKIRSIMSCLGVSFFSRTSLISWLADLGCSLLRTSIMIWSSCDSPFLSFVRVSVSPNFARRASRLLVDFVLFKLVSLVGRLLSRTTPLSEWRQKVDLCQDCENEKYANRQGCSAQASLFYQYVCSSIIW